MVRYKYLVFLALCSFIIGCQSNTDDAPSNNEFSYLDRGFLKGEDETVKIVAENETIDFECNAIHVELTGNVFNKSIDNLNINILSLNAPYSINCTNNKEVTANNIVLNTNDEIDLNLYLGGSVIAVGEIKKSIYAKDQLPLEMNVIRIATIKGMVK